MAPPVTSTGGQEGFKDGEVADVDVADVAIHRLPNIEINVKPSSWCIFSTFI